MKQEKSLKDIAELKSYYIKRLNEIVETEFDIDKANFGIYLEDHNYDYGSAEESHIVGNKTGVEKFALSLLNSSLKSTDDYVSLEHITDWDYGNIFIQGIKFSDKKSINEAFNYDDSNTPFSGLIVLVILLLLITSIIVGLSQIFKWIF